MQYADQIFMQIDGVPVEIMSFRRTGTGVTRKTVKTMNPAGIPLGTVQGMGDVTFSVDVPVRAGLPRWSDITNSTVTFVQRVAGTPMSTAIGAFFTGELEQGTDAESGEQKYTVNFGCLMWTDAG